MSAGRRASRARPWRESLIRAACAAVLAVLLSAGGVRAATAATPAHAHASEHGAVLLPAALCNARAYHFASVRPVTPAATRTPLPSRTPLPTTVLPSPTPPPMTPTPVGPPVCDRPLAERLYTHEIAVDGVIEQGAAGQWTRYPMYTAVREDASSLVGWSTAGDEVHVTPLDRDRHRSGDDIVLRGDTIRGLVALADGGGAALVARPDDMALVRWDADGRTIFDNTLVGTVSHSIEGSKWIDDWGYEGRLVWTGRMFAAYFGHTQWFGANGKHQGDLLWLFDDEGTRVQRAEAGGYPTWDWGCSHSLDLRLTHNARSDALGPVCLSDAYPSPGFIFRNAQRIGAAVSADGRGRADGYLGGIVPVGDGFAVDYSTRAQRRSFDVALTLLDAYGFSLADFWLTDTAGVEETGPHLARYGDDLFAAWKAGSSLMGTVVDLDGKTVAPVVPLDGGMVDRDDLVNYPSGDVGWTYASANRRSLVSAVVEYCRTP